MNKIPATEEFLRSFKDKIGLRSQSSPLGSEDMEKEALIEFAKLHVEAALKKAQKRHRETQTYEPEHRDIVNSAILNAYPLENIK